jgi:hypothetical protein
MWAKSVRLGAFAACRQFCSTSHGSRCRQRRRATLTRVVCGCLLCQPYTGEECCARPATPRQTQVPWRNSRYRSPVHKFSTYTRFLQHRVGIPLSLSRPRCGAAERHAVRRYDARQDEGRIRPNPHNWEASNALEQDRSQTAGTAGMGISRFLQLGDARR